MMKRYIAFFILFIPGVFAAYGIKLMRDMVFGISQLPFVPLWIQFLVGLILAIAGIGFIAGFILYRDRKKNKVSSRFNSPE
jgi:membrane protein implicated in regulation of membrane protease activity